MKKRYERPELALDLLEESVLTASSGVLANGMISSGKSACSTKSRRSSAVPQNGHDAAPCEASITIRAAHFGQLSSTRGYSTADLARAARCRFCQEATSAGNSSALRLLPQ